MNKSSIIGRMFANAQVNMGPTNLSQQQDLTLTESRSASPMMVNTRRNLFGIRLNHDQLAQDLKDMWQESIDRQNQNWGFDFQKLRPLEAKPAKTIASNNADKAKEVKRKNCEAEKVQKQRFEWTKINTKLTSFYNETELKPSTFDKQELLTLSSDYETEEEEEDDALAIPTFYKYQRRAKLNEEHNRLKLISHLASSVKKSAANSVHTNAFSKMNNSSSSGKSLAASTGKKKTAKMHRPSARKLDSANVQQCPTTRDGNYPSLPTTPVSNKSLIITLSENRKDTLRSAAVTMATDTRAAAKNLGDMFEKSAGSLEHVSSAFKQPLKQQSLLEMLKQRKRKTSTTTADAKHSAVVTTVAHNLRPRATSLTSN